jgi:hypothetical protein
MIVPPHNSVISYITEKTVCQEDNTDMTEEPTFLGLSVEKRLQKERDIINGEWAVIR